MMSWILILISYAILAFTYITLGKPIAEALNAFGYSSDGLIIGIAFVFLLVTIWTFGEARSQSKYFKKREKSTQDLTDQNEQAISVKFSQTFSANLIGNVLGIAGWFFLLSDEFVITNGMFYSASILVIACFAIETVARILASKLMINASLGQIAWSLKFVLCEHFIIYGLFAWAFYSYSKYSTLG